MASDAVLLERAGEVAVLTLNRPQKRNALGQELLGRLTGLVADCEADPSCRAVVLTGAGGAFCAGGDISEMRPRSAIDRRQNLHRFHALARMLAHASKVYVAAVDGPASGAGFSIAMLCDMVVTSSSAAFSAAFARVGLMPDVALLWSLPNRIGAARAKQVMLSGERIDAARALQMGISDAVAGPDGVVADAVAAARKLCQGAPLATAIIKAAFARAPARIDDVLAMELDGQPLLATTGDHAEGVAAFRERRPPVFKAT